MATTIHIDGFADRLKALEVDYFETHYHECPPIVAKTMERMNALSAGTRNPTMVISTLSPGMHISTPSGRVMTPVTSVVLK